MFSFVGGVLPAVIETINPSTLMKSRKSAAEAEHIREAMAEVGQVAEGVNTLNLVKQKAIELDIYMPLVMGLDAVLSNPGMAFDVAKALMRCAT